MLYDPRPAQDLLRRHETAKYPIVCNFGGATLTVANDVFCPTFTNTSRVLLEGLDVVPQERVLDAFCGSGAFGIVAALRGAQVVAIDKSRAAVECARANAQANGVAHHVDVRLGDVRTPDEVLRHDERFDLLIANPPLLPDAPTTPLSEAIFDPEYQATTMFITLVERHMAEGGRALMLTSDVLERYGLDVGALCDDRGLAEEIILSRDVGYERYRVHRIVRQSTTKGSHVDDPV